MLCWNENPYGPSPAARQRVSVLAPAGEARTLEVRSRVESRQNEFEDLVYSARDISEPVGASFFCQLPPVGVFTSAFSWITSPLRVATVEGVPITIST